jgi:opacity protein-like surface antigen
MKLVKQLKVLTLQVTISLIFLNTQFSLAQKKINWEGPYVGLGIQSLDGDMNGRFKSNNNLHSKDITGKSTEFLIGYNNNLTYYGINDYIIGLELSYSDKDFLLNNTKSKRDCPGTSYDCKSSINYSWSAKTKLGFKYENFLPNLFLGYTEHQITIRTDLKENIVFDPGFHASNLEGSTQKVGGVLYGMGLDYYFNNNFFISVSYIETQMNKKEFHLKNSGNVKTELKYNANKVTLNYHF